jgi:quercetin dioxygenase-like cupin family protein
MKIDFELLEKVKIEKFKGGDGELYLKKFEDQSAKIMQSFLTAGSTIGEHTHTEDSEIIYVLSGEGCAECDGKKELLSKGAVHYCPKNSTHTIKNTGNADLVMYAIVIKNL